LAHVPPRPPPPNLRVVVEAALNVTFLNTQSGRDAVLMMLRPELAANIPRLSTTRMDLMSIVSTCAHYGALAELVDAIRFYADETTAMAHLDAVIIRQLPPAG